MDNSNREGFENRISGEKESQTKQEWTKHLFLLKRIIPLKTNSILQGDNIKHAFSIRLHPRKNTGNNANLFDTF